MSIAVATDSLFRVNLCRIFSATGMEANACLLPSFSTSTSRRVSGNCTNSPGFFSVNQFGVNIQPRIGCLRSMAPWNVANSAEGDPELITLKGS
ncbi:hypothetical protein D9M71_668370 [compost metagenome]